MLHQLIPINDTADRLPPDKRARAVADQVAARNPLAAAARRPRQPANASIDPSAFERLTDYLAAVFGTRRWVVAPRLTSRLRDRGYEAAIRQDRYRAVQQAWEDAHGFAMGFPPEMQPDWLRAAIASYLRNERLDA